MPRGEGSVERYVMAYVRAVWWTTPAGSATRWFVSAESIASRRAAGLPASSVRLGVVDEGHRSATRSQLESVRRAIRSLAKRGMLEVQHFQGAVRVAHVPFPERVANGVRPSSYLAGLALRRDNPPVDLQPVTPTHDERDLLLGFLHRQRDLVVATAAGLTSEQARSTPSEGLLPITGVINHLTHVEWRWIDGHYLGSPFPAREEEFWVQDLTLGRAVSAYRARETRTERIVREAPSLDVACLGSEGDLPPPHVTLGLPEPLDLRWVLLHLIEETAHHAGHADATRELLDGTKTRPLDD